MKPCVSTVLRGKVCTTLFLLSWFFPYADAQTSVTVASGNPQNVNASATYTGAFGNVAIYYTVCTRYVGGYTCMFQPVAATRTLGISKLGGGNSVRVSWSPGISGATGYDVIRSSSNGAFSGSCSNGCAIALNVSGTSYTDSSSASGSNYPPSGLNRIQAASGQINLNNTGYQTPGLFWTLQGKNYPFALIPLNAVPGHCPQFSAQPPFLADSGSGCGGGGGSPAGSDGQLQYNNSGAFGASPAFSVDKVNGLMTLTPTGSGTALTVNGDSAGDHGIDVFTNGSTGITAGLRRSATWAAAYEADAGWPYDFYGGTGWMLVGSNTFANLGTPGNGSFLYCSDCTQTNPCAGSGSGAMGVYVDGVWQCGAGTTGGGGGGTIATTLYVLEGDNAGNAVASSILDNGTTVSTAEAFVAGTVTSQGTATVNGNLNVSGTINPGYGCSGAGCITSTQICDSGCANPMTIGGQTTGPMFVVNGPMTVNGSGYGVQWTNPVTVGTLPTCNSGNVLLRAAVTDAVSATPGTTAVGSGTYTIAVQCIFNSTGSVYTWIID